LSGAVQENVPSVLTSAVPETKELNAEAATAMAASFLKRIGHKEGLKPKRVSFEDDLYTVEVEVKQFTATVKIDSSTRQIKEYEMQPKGEESTLSPISPRILFSMAIVSCVVNIGLFFAFKIFGF
jgi:hypothetical protein